MSEAFSAERLAQLEERWRREPQSRVFLQVAEEYRRGGDLRRAVELLEQGLGKHPGYVSALVLLGRCRLEGGDPPAAIEGVIDEMVDDFKSQLSRIGWQYQDYLNLQGMTEDDLRKDFSENAEDRLRHQLVLRQLILDEKLRVEQADVDRLVEERTARFENEALRDSMRQYYNSGHGFDLISSEVLSDKVYDRIRDVLSGSAPDLDVLADEIDEEE